MSDLKSHPRLIATEAHFERLRQPTDHPLLIEAQKVAEGQAEQALASFDVKVDASHHNALLSRARDVQARVLTLLVRWRQSDEARYRTGAMDYIRMMGQWSDWSWIAMRQGKHGPMTQFDLSYGENCATLALAYDWLGETITDEERALFVDIAQTWGIEPYLYHTGMERPPFWYHAPGNNWNTVCTGGAGMLALAMYEHLDKVDEVLRRTESSFRPYMEHLDECGGGWSEGVGYWNFGMLYAYRYLLSWSRAHGQRHPLLNLDGSNRTLEFPLDFTPNGVAIGFGDVNRFRPFAFHYAACEEYGRTDLYPRLDAELNGNPRGGRGNAAELLLFHPRQVDPIEPDHGPFAKRYPAMDWAVLADVEPTPHLCLSIRGGTTEVNHSHLDLMSFNVAVGDEPLLGNVNNSEYIDTTFSERRYDLWEIRPDAKNTVFINGVGIKPKTGVSMQEVDAGGLVGYRVSGAGAFGQMRDGPVAEACNRVWLLLDEGHALVVDRFRVPFYARYEARFHTPFEPKVEGASVRIDGERQTLHLRFASSQPAGVYRAVNPVTSVEKSSAAHMLRWCTEGLFGECWFATLLSRDAASAVTLEAEEAGEGASATVSIDGPTGRRTLRFDEALAVIEVEASAAK